jgi:hypothetical protein
LKLTDGFEEDFQRKIRKNMHSGRS